MVNIQIHIVLRCLRCRDRIRISTAVIHKVIYENCIVVKPLNNVLPNLRPAIEEWELGSVNQWCTVKEIAADVDVDTMLLLIFHIQYVC